jgi:hypothetical protein
MRLFMDPFRGARSGMVSAVFLTAFAARMVVSITSSCRFLFFVSVDIGMRWNIISCCLSVVV